MAEMKDLNVTDASNTARFPENQQPSTVNNGMRATEGLLARWKKDIDGSVSSAGTNTITLAAGSALTAYAAGDFFVFKAGGTNTGAATINIDSVGAKTIQKNLVALVAGDIQQNDIVAIYYDGTQFQMISPARTPVLTAGGIAGASVAIATASTRGSVEFATDAETITGSSTTLALTPANLQAMTGSDSRDGILELATTAETVTGTDTARAITPAGLHGALAGLTDTTIATGDSIVFADTSDSNALKEDTVQGILDLASGGGFTLGTEQATTSGTSWTFGSIPTGTTMIVINFEGCRFSGSEDFLVTIGDAGGLESSGYISDDHRIESDGTHTAATSTANYIVFRIQQARIANGHMTLTLKDASNFTWIESHVINTVTGSSNELSIGTGTKSLSAELTQVSLSGGTGDAGSINIMYI